MFASTMPKRMTANDNDLVNKIDERMQMIEQMRAEIDDLKMQKLQKSSSPKLSST